MQVIFSKAFKPLIINKNELPPYFIAVTSSQNNDSLVEGYELTLFNGIYIYIYIQAV